MKSSKWQTKDIVLVALLAAVLVAGKLALAFLPNVECVTFLVIVFTTVFGFSRTGLAVVVFILIDNALWGFGYYTLSYFIQWLGLVAVTAVVSRKGVRSEYIYTVVALVMVIFFGIHTTLLDCVVLGGPFWARYLAGVLFYAVQILSACFLTLFAFKPVYKMLKKQAGKYYSDPKEANNT